MNKDDYDPVLISLVRETLPNIVAADLCSVQPMGNTIAEAVYTPLTGLCPSEEELRKEGFEPVCETTKVLWVKKDEK